MEDSNAMPVADELVQAEEIANELDQSVETAIDAIKLAMENPGDLRHWVKVELCRLAYHILNASDDWDSPSELIPNERLKPTILGQILMINMDHDNMAAEERGTSHSSLKRDLLETAQWMGPDHLENLRWGTAFMIKVEGFN